MKVEASAPGKCILFGEHAVVFGQPAVAVAIEQRITVIIEPIEGEYWKLEDSMHRSTLTSTRFATVCGPKVRVHLPYRFTSRATFHVHPVLAPLLH
jgi:mevalonate kinase